MSIVSFLTVQYHITESVILDGIASLNLLWYTSSDDQ
jgi:hypothetical protein